MKKITLLICFIGCCIGAIQAQKKSIASIEELEQRRIELGSQTGKVTDYFSVEEINKLQNYYATKNVSQKSEARFTDPLVAYAVENITSTVGTFDPANPSVFNPIGSSAPVGNDFEGAGALDPNNPDTIYVIDSTGLLYSVSVPSGIYTTLGDLGISNINGLEFNPMDGILYAVSDTNLYSIDITEVSAAFIGSLGNTALAIALAIDGEGNAYTYDVVDDLLYSVDLTTGAATAIGSIGFDSNYGQGMTWDVNTNKIYMTAFNVGLFDSQLHLVNTTTGGTSLIAQMEPETLSHYSWLAIPFTPIICNETAFDATSVPFDIDGTESSTSDCASDPNEISITVDDYGIIGESATFTNVTVNITHEFSSDLDLYLISPSGSQLALSEALGGSTVNAYNTTVFEDEGADISNASSPFGTGPYAPVGGLFADVFQGESITGDWILKICDNINSNTGQVLQFSMEICIPPSSDECQFAIPLTCGDMVNGETLDASDSGGNTAADKFYSYTGTGGPEEITISLCGSGTDYDSVLRVFDSCNLSNEIAFDDDFCGAQSQVTFNSDGVTTYIIMVEGSGNETGNFTLNVSCIELLVNDNCNGALPIVCGQTITGSTVLANLDNDVPQCGAVPITGPGVWYKLSTETGLLTDYTISLCGSDFDTKISVYSGDCGNLVCEEANEDFCGTQSEVAFQGDGNTTYYILIHGEGVGNYTLNVDCVPVPPVNDECVSAIPLVCGDSITGQTTDATDSGGNDAPDEFYTYTGNGEPELIVVSLCENTVYDSVLRVYDSCDLSNELFFDDDFCGSQSQISFTSDGTTTYYIMVEGFGNESGNYTLNLTCQTPILNDECEGAIPIACGETLNGTTFGANGDNETAPYCSAPIISPGVWYKFSDDSGIVNDFTLSLCGSDFDTQLAVYTGECGNLICEIGNDDFCVAGSQVSFQGDGNTDYYFLIHAYGGDTGNYIINLECDPVLGVEENALMDFSYYPNPTSDVLTLKNNKLIERVSIYNLIGQSVMEYQVDALNFQIDTSNLSTGAFFMKVYINGQVGIYKIIKE